MKQTSQGLLTEIERFALNDGPGIRTTVFFKGCDLHCAWCHNPETIQTGPELHDYPKQCIGCRQCLAVCPNGALRFAAGRRVLDRSRCRHCGRCAAVCQAESLVMSGQWLSVDAVMREIRQDQAYYAESGGGVTLSGGEVLCQAGYALELTAACQASGIAVALETNLHTGGQPPSPCQMQLLQKVDLILFDLKLIDPSEHRRWTGSDNGRILANAEMLSKLDRPLIVRTPLIPGVTDAPDNLLRIAEWAARLTKVQYYELLNFNPLGAAKYQSLGRHNPFAAARPLPPQRLAEIAGLLSTAGIPVRIS